MLWVESKASAMDRVIGLIAHKERGAGAVAMGETIWETECLSLLHYELGAKVFLQIFIISKQTVMITAINQDKECQLLGCNHPLQW
jgi:hypothetical protein